MPCRLSNGSFPASLVLRKLSNESFPASLVLCRLSNGSFPASLVLRKLSNGSFPVSLVLRKLSNESFPASLVSLSKALLKASLCYGQPEIVVRPNPAPFQYRDPICVTRGPLKAILCYERAFTCSLVRRRLSNWSFPVSLVPPWCLPGCLNGSFLPPWCLPGASKPVRLILSCLSVPPWCLPGYPNGSFLPRWRLPGVSQAVQWILSCLPGASQKALLKASLC